jgi:hypothetical protein
VHASWGQPSVNQQCLTINMQQSGVSCGARSKHDELHISVQTVERLFALALGTVIAYML